MDSENIASDGELSGIYELLVNTIGKKQTQGIGIEEVNRRCLHNISTELGDSFSAATSNIVDGLSKSKRIAGEVDNLPDIMNRELQDLKEKLKIPLLGSIQQKVMTLLAQLHAAAEDPAQLYPRLVCGSIPVDPAKVTKFSKQYRILERLNELDGQLNVNDRSMSRPPKSSAEAMTKVSASAESISNAVLDSINCMSRLDNDFRDISEFATTLSQVKAPIDELLNQQEEAYGTMRRLRAIFSTEDEHSDTESERYGERDFEAGILETVQTGSGLLDNIIQSQSVLDDSVLRIRSLTGLFVEQTDSFQKRLKNIFDLFKRLRSVLEHFVTNIPRLAREIRQFFVPTGWRAYILRPSDDLVNLLSGMEEVKTALPDPDSLEKSVTENIAKSDLVGRMKRIKENIEDITRIPSRLIEEVREQDFQQKITASVRNTLLSLLDELLSSAVDEMKQNVENVLGHFTNRFEDFLPQHNSPDHESTRENDRKKSVFNELADEVQGSSLFKAIF